MSGLTFGDLTAATDWPEAKFSLGLDRHFAGTYYSIPHAGVVRMDKVVVPATTARSSTSQPTIGSLQQEIQLLRDRLDALEAENVVVIRSIDPERLKKELLTYFRANPDTYPSDAAIALCLDAAAVREAVGELVAEGLLG